jgi:hypothetical protein
MTQSIGAYDNPDAFVGADQPNLAVIAWTLCAEPGGASHSANSSLRRDRHKQFVICRINDADKGRSAYSTFQDIALKAALIDVGLVAPIELKRGVALWACGLL